MNFLKKLAYTLVLLPVLVSAQQYQLNPDFDANTVNAPAGGGGNCGSPINPFVNCGFETGDFTGWNTVDLTTPFFPWLVDAAGIDPGFMFFISAPTEGVFAAYNGFDGDGPGTIEITQDITVPATGERLIFDYRGAWDTSFGATVDRTFEVQIQPSGGGVPLQTTLIETAMPNTTVTDTGANTATVDLSGFSGQSIRVAMVWNIPENFTGPGFFQLDNVAVFGPPPPIPTLSRAGLVAAVITLALAGFLVLRRRADN